MKHISAALVCSLIAFSQLPAPCFLAFSQASNPASVLQDGTAIRLRLNRNLSSADAHTGDTVDFEVLDEVRVGQVVVIPRNSTALGTVTDAEAKKRMGRAGKLDVNIDSVRLADGEKVLLRGVRAGSGGSHTGAMTGAIVATSLVAWPAAPLFLLMHGKDITLPKGTEITAYVNGDIPLEMSRFNAAHSESGTPSADSEYHNSAAGVNANVTSSAPGADVEIDGNYVGSTPSQLQLTPGMHTITVKKNGYKQWSRTLNVSGGSLNINANLESLIASR